MDGLQIQRPVPAVPAPTPCQHCGDLTVFPECDACLERTEEGENCCTSCGDWYATPSRDDQAREPLSGEFCANCVAHHHDIEATDNTQGLL